MASNTIYAWLRCGLGFISIFTLFIVARVVEAGTPTKLLPIEEDCAINEKFPDLQCNQGHEIYRYTQLSHDFNSASSCATCDCEGYTGTEPKNSPDEEFYNLGPQCCEGWQGSQCDLCQTVDVCPLKVINGSSPMAATSCTARSMAPLTIEEAKTGKKFSCSCGGGGDFESRFACPQQGTCKYYAILSFTADDKTLPDGANGAPVTRFDWTYFSTGSIELAMNAGIHSRSWEDYPGEFEYLYPIVWTADLTGCTITEGECMALGGSSDDFAEQVCVNYKCADTEVSCPPKGKPECPGGVNSCDIPEGQEKPYQMHRCSVLPDSGVSFETSCIKEPNEDGSFLCFFKQPTLTAPMSMTCYTGTCLYNSTNGTDTVDYDETTHYVPRGLLWQQLLLGGFVVSIFILVAALRLLGNRRDCRQEAEYFKGIDFKVANFEALPSDRITLSWNNISLWVQDGYDNEKQIIQDSKGRAFGLTALLGPSGSGKTSLLDILASRKNMHRVDGTMHINGNFLKSECMRRISGYVPQEDVFPGYLTVYEHLLFHAALRWPTPIRDSDIRRKVHEVLNILDLNKCALNRIGDDFNRGLSGGEKRRVSLAEELLIQPTILLLDEPTTGLDSSSAKAILFALSELSRRGTTVLMSLHQPSVSLFRILDNVIVLSKGKVIFEGPPSAVPSHIDKVNDMCTSLEEISSGFASYSSSKNPADLLLDIASCTVRSSLAQAITLEYQSVMDITSKNEFNAIVAQETLPKRHVATMWMQVKILSSRLITAALRRPTLLLLQYAGCTFLAFASGAIFFDLKEDLYGVQDRFGVLFFIPFCLVLLGLSSLHCWRDERILLLHEKSYKLIYGFSAYFISAILFDVVFVRILPPTFFALISYRMIGLNQGCNYCLLTFALILVLTNMISSLMAMVVGAFHFSLPTAQLIGVVITLYFALFSGYLVNKKSVGQSGFLSLISTDPLSYSFEALLINQFGSQSDEDGNEVYYFINGSMCAPSLPTTLSSGDMILGTFGFEDKEHALRTDILALAFVALIYLVLTFGVSISSVSDLLKRCTRFCTARNHFRTQTNESLDPRDDEIRGNLLSHVDDLHEEGVATNMPLEDLLEEHLGRNSAANLVLSFHDISLCVPSNGECRTSYENVGSILEQKISTIVESRDTNLGISVEKDPESGLGRLAQILPGSWAQRQGLLVGDVVVAVGGITITASDDLFVVLEGSLCPFSIEVLRGRKYKSDFFASRQAQEVPTESNCTNTNCSTPFYGDLKLDEDPAVPISEPCGNRTWILRGVSGSTISSKYYNDMTQLSHSRIVSMPHMLTALLGPSGSGKTSLLDILSGRKTVGTFTGSVRINGKIMTSSDMRSLSGYVIQEDILPGPLSVRECLRFQAQLRVLGSPSTITQRVNDVLERMELHSHQEQIIGTALHRGLSGGEKRRLSVAIELLSKPAILFCDEPTTGLDSHSALSLCRILEDVARSGTTVIISIHQPGPEILKLITQAIFMTRDGRVCFSGPGEKLENYLVEYSRYTPIDEGCHADAMLNEISSCNQDALVKAFKASRSGQAEREVLAFLSNLQQNSRQLKCGEDLIESRGKHIAPWTTQFRHLSYRTMRYSMRNPFPFILHGITAVAAALILGLAFHDISKFNEETAGVQNRFGIMFFLVLYLSLLALTSLSIWREDQRLFVVERGSGIYCTSSYLSATFLFDVLPYRMLPPLAFTLIAYPMIGLNDVSSGHRWIFFAVLLASNLTFSSICMLVGTLARSNASANAAGSLTMLTSILFCGFLFSKRDMPWLLWYILRWSPGSYAFESLVVNEMSGLKDLYITTTISHSEARAGPFSGEEISGCFGFTGGVRFNLVTLFIMAGVYFIGVFFVMKKFTKEVR